MRWSGVLRRQHIENPLSTVGAGIVSIFYISELVLLIMNRKLSFLLLLEDSLSYHIPTSLLLAQIGNLQHCLAEVVSPEHTEESLNSVVNALSDAQLRLE